MSSDKELEQEIRMNELIKALPQKTIQDQVLQTEPLSIVNDANNNLIDANEIVDDNRFEIPTEETKSNIKEEASDQESNSLSSLNSSILNNVSNDLDAKLK